MLSNFKFLNYFIIYLVSGLLAHTLLDGIVFESLFTSGFEPILKFIFTGNEHALLPQIKLADKNFFFHIRGNLSDIFGCLSNF